MAHRHRRSPSCHRLPNPPSVFFFNLLLDKNDRAILPSIYCVELRRANDAFIIHWPSVVYEAPCNTRDRTLLSELWLRENISGNFQVWIIVLKRKEKCGINTELNSSLRLWKRWRWISERKIIIAKWWAVVVLRQGRPRWATKQYSPAFEFSESNAKQYE